MKQENKDGESTYEENKGGTAEKSVARNKRINNN